MTSDETPAERWKAREREHAGRIVDNINLVRDARGLTIRDLRERLNALGWPVSDSTLTGILSARKRATVATSELSVIARALDVPAEFLVTYRGLDASAEDQLEAVHVWRGDASSRDPLVQESRKAVELVDASGDAVDSLVNLNAVYVMAQVLPDDERERLPSEVTSGFVVKRKVLSILGALEESKRGRFPVQLAPLPNGLDGVSRAEVMRMDLPIESLVTDEALREAETVIRRTWYGAHA